MPIPDTDKRTFEVVVHGTIGAGGSDAVPTQFVFHYSRTSTAPAITKAALHGALYGAITKPFDLLAACLNEGWSFDHTAIRCLNDAL